MLNRGRHLYSAGRSLRLALAHISSEFFELIQVYCHTYANVEALLQFA